MSTNPFLLIKTPFWLLDIKIKIFLFMGKESWDIWISNLLHLTTFITYMHVTTIIISVDPAMICNYDGSTCSLVADEKDNDDWRMVQAVVDQAHGKDHTTLTGRWTYYTLTHIKIQ